MLIKSYKLYYFTFAGYVKKASATVSNITSCSAEQWRCKDGIECIWLNATCNGVSECQDGSDETISLCGN